MSDLRPGTGTARAPDGSRVTDPLVIPGHRLETAPGTDRRLRRWTTVIGVLTVALIVLGLGAVSATTWLVGRGFSPTPAITSLGSPSSLILRSNIGDLRVLPSGDVDELTLALVERGSTALPAPDEQVQARLSQSTATGATTIEVLQPSRTFGPPWSVRTRDVLVLVPSDLELALELRGDVGDMHVDGEFTSLDVHSGTGDLRLGPLSAPGGVSARADVGDVELELGSPAPTAVEVSTGVGNVDLHLPTDAAGRVEVTSDTGDLEIAVPGTSRWTVRAASDLGEVSTARGLSGSTDDTAVGTLTATSSLGDIDITR